MFHDGTIFGFSNALRGVWMAQDWKTGAVLWSKKVGNGRSGSIAMADGLLYCYDDADGICYLAEPSKEGGKNSVKSNCLRKHPPNVGEVRFGLTL